MRGLIFIFVLGVPASSVATEVLSAVGFAEVALRAARRAERPFGVESAREARDMFDKASTNATWRRATLNDVPPNLPLEDGVLMTERADADLARVTSIAREFRGEAEIANALAGMQADLVDFGNRFVAAVNRAYPPTRWSEYARHGLWPMATMLVTALGTESVETLTAQVPVTLVGLYRNELRVREARERRAGVPKLEHHLRLVARALADTAETRRRDMRRVFSMVRARANVTPEVHQILFNPHDTLTDRQFARLVEAGRHVVTRWTDPAPTVDETHEILIESILYTRADAGDPSLRWVLAYSAVAPPVDGGGGIAVGTTCPERLAPRAALP